MNMMNLRYELEKNNKMIGGHVSIAENISRAPERANNFQFDTFQIFVKSNMQWNYKKIGDDNIKKFKENIKKYNIKKTVAHATYLINFGTDNKLLLDKSIEDLKYEIEACNELGINYLVVHPGSNKDRKNSMKNIMEILNSFDTKNVELLVENSSGKGNTLPSTIEEMEYMIALSDNNAGICLDTCHFFAYGYDIKNDYDNVIYNLKSDNLIKRIKVIHLNDSMFDLNSKKDRHENIGNGFIGLKGFSNIINDNNFNNIPLIMETPEGDKNYSENLNKIVNLMVNK